MSLFVNKFFCLDSTCLLNEPKTKVQVWLIINKQIWTSFFSSQTQVVHDRLGSFTAAWVVNESQHVSKHCQSPNSLFFFSFFFLFFVWEWGPYGLFTISLDFRLTSLHLCAQSACVNNLFNDTMVKYNQDILCIFMFIFILQRK